MTVAVPTGPIRVDARPLGYEPALDGMRAVAVLAVMLFHFVGPEIFTGGLIGVDVFFVLSGFLITNLLLDEQRRAGAVSLRGFYHRRALRLFPAMYSLLALVTLAALFIGREYPTVWAEIGAAALYSYQWFLAFFGFPEPGSPRVLFHLWSLSVEEWFYFVWPFVLLVGLRSVLRQRVLLWAAGAWAAMWMLVRLSGDVVGVDWASKQPFAGTGVGYPGEVLYRMSAMRFDMLVAGCLLAVAVRRWGWRAGAPTVGPDPGSADRPRWLPAVAGVALVLLVAELLLAGRVGVFDPFGSLGFNAALLGLPALVLWIHLHPDGHAGRWLSVPVVVWIGRRSYGLYLWHEVLNVLAPKAASKAALVGRTGVLFLLSFGVAELSWRFIESPFLRRKEARYGRPEDRVDTGSGT